MDDFLGIYLLWWELWPGSALEPLAPRILKICYLLSQRVWIMFFFFQHLESSQERRQDVDCETWGSSAKRRKGGWSEANLVISELGDSKMVLPVIKHGQLFPTIFPHFSLVVNFHDFAMKVWRFLGGYPPATVDDLGEGQVDVPWVFLGKTWTNL